MITSSSDMIALWHNTLSLALLLCTYYKKQKNGTNKFIMRVALVRKYRNKSIIRVVLVRKHRSVVS